MLGMTAAIFFRNRLTVGCHEAGASFWKSRTADLGCDKASLPHCGGGAVTGFDALLDFRFFFAYTFRRCDPTTLEDLWH